MISQRDRQLEQLGIIQWTLRCQAVLQGEIGIFLFRHVRLVMIADELPALNKTFISDVLRTLQISSNQVLQITPDRVSMLPSDSYCNSWQLGCEKEIVLQGFQLVSPKFTELQTNPSAKSALWQQIYKNIKLRGSDPYP